MNTNCLSAALIAGIIGMAGFTPVANAVNLNPRGLGQALLYPYYTVNAQQNTLISVVNATALAKAVRVRFLEGYNGRDVLDFNVFLSEYDVWTAAVFALADAGVVDAQGQPSKAAGLLTSDNSCTYPALTMSTLPGGTAYVALRHFGYTGTLSDGGPTGDDRTREGHFEIIAMGDAVPHSALEAAISHVNGVPPDCPDAETLAATSGNLQPPASGLFGAASVVNVANGTYFSYDADALEGFTATTLFSEPGAAMPSLAQVNDNGAPNTVTAHVYSNGASIEAVYPAINAIDAVSAVFDTATVFNEWQTKDDGSVGTDWVVTFPTKRFYVDALYTGGGPDAIAPFEYRFDQLLGLPGTACIEAGFNLFDRETVGGEPFFCGFSNCPPPPLNSICLETNVITFNSSSILNSNLLKLVPVAVVTQATAGWLGLSFTGSEHGGLPLADSPAHALRPDNNGTVFYGLPVTGFEAINFVNGNLGGVLANYSGTHRLHTSNCADTHAVAGNCL